MTEYVSPLDPKGYSFIHSFRRARWLSIKRPISRAVIIATFIAWVTISIISLFYNKSPNKAFKQTLIRVGLCLKICNDLTIPLHTLLTCASEIDRLYLVHLLLYGVTEAVIGIFTTTTEKGPNEVYVLWRVLGMSGIAIQLFAHLLWFIPTRILYYKTFHLAKDCLNIESDKLLQQFIKPWMMLFFSSMFVTVGLLFLLPKLCKGHSFLIESNVLTTACIMIFELFMYSKIDPLKSNNRFPVLGTMHERFYAMVAAILVCFGVGKIISTSVAGKLVNAYVATLLRTLRRVVNGVRFIVLWYYCLGELDYDAGKATSATAESPIDGFADIVDFSKLTPLELAKLEILV